MKLCLTKKNKKIKKNHKKLKLNLKFTSIKKNVKIFVSHFKRNSKEICLGYCTFKRNSTRKMLWKKRRLTFLCNKKYSRKE